MIALSVIISEPWNPSSHNVISMSISTNEYNHVSQNNCVYEQGNKSTIKWYKADKGHISNYERCLDYMLCNDIDLYKLVKIGSVSVMSTNMKLIYYVIQL